MSRRPRLRRSDYALPAAELAPRLLGAVLVRIDARGARTAGVIVETEAYIGPEDLASHARGGRRTPRVESMYAAPGTSYVYFTYGAHFCFNVAADREGHPGAVLVRALEPTEGLDRMRRRRTRPGASPPSDRLLCAGPGRLTQALAIDRSFDALDMTRDLRLFIERADPATIRARAILRTPRIGIGDCGPWTDARLRFLLHPSEHLSRQPSRARLAGLSPPGR